MCRNWLQEHSIVIKHIKGRENIITDALSRIFVDWIYYSVTVSIVPVLWKSFRFTQTLFKGGDVMIISYFVYMLMCVTS